MLGGRRGAHGARLGVRGGLHRHLALLCKRDEVVIDATLGLGEALVRGRRTRTTTSSTRRDVSPSRRSAEKALTIRLIRAGVGRALAATGRRRSPGAARRLPLSGGAALAEPGGRQGARRTPEDIEWAFADGRLYFLQSRPITRLYPPPDARSAEPLRAMSLVRVEAGNARPDHAARARRDLAAGTLMCAGRASLPLTPNGEMGVERGRAGESICI